MELYCIPLTVPCSPAASWSFHNCVGTCAFEEAITSQVFTINFSRECSLWIWLESLGGPGVRWQGLVCFLDLHGWIWHCIAYVSQEVAVEVHTMLVECPTPFSLPLYSLAVWPYHFLQCPGWGFWKAEEVELISLSLFHESGQRQLDSILAFLLCLHRGWLIWINWDSFCLLRSFFTCVLYPGTTTSFVLIQNYLYQ